MGWPSWARVEDRIEWESSAKSLATWWAVSWGPVGYRQGLVTVEVARGGRPSGHSEAVADTICQERRAGWSLRAIGAMKGKPVASMV